ncbi:TetR family transcriptional regulator [Streptomyces sp. Root431]|uniref:TetR/AcrR family transcriptional regulator n=1 Tax=Streptomyces sp. Root431 TaxID=1736535 RepID=UPI0006F49AED|nr:TetR/AcrR family transcriptional regulator [Streptomyces sp. Root431]KQX11944.1 TetR family transcriptional regulator [Streptomyces sp. Root431]
MGGGAKARRLPRVVRERQMMDAAVRCFARHGYQAASMDEIAELAGVSKPLVYLYLGSKEELFTACIRREARALLGAVAAGVEDRSRPADEQLWAGLLAFFTYVADHPDAWVVLSRRAWTQGEPFADEASRMREEIAAFVAGLIGEAHGGGSGRDVRGLAQALVGAAESLADWAAESPGAPGTSAKEAAATLMNFAWVGLGNLMKSERWSPP